MEAVVAPALAAEFPGLALLARTTPCVPGRSPADIRARLDDLADRWRGPQAIGLRQRPVVQAQRVFFRHVGLDPDVHRVPQEAAIVQRLVDGGFRSHGTVADALTIATVETGVGVWALDAAKVGAGLQLRPDADGTLVIADPAGPIHALFHDPPRDRGPSRATRSLVLYAVQLPGVPPLFSAEALDLAVELLEGEE